MKFVIAPDSFKESMTALEACEAIERGVRSVFPDADIIKVPMADGGEGTVQSLVDATGGRIERVEVTGPLGIPVSAFYGVLGHGTTAIIEMAAASGIGLVPAAERNPLKTTSRGTGELIVHAMDAGVQSIMLGLGGSATNDGGVGMAQALGFRFLRHDGSEIDAGGGSLGEIASIDCSQADKRLLKMTFAAACDVDNPLIGERGASAVFGPQKGATPEMIEQLDANLTHLAALIRNDMGKAVADMAGAGAAGGLGAGVVAFLNAELKRGVDIVIEATGLAGSMRGADFVITGEGRIDSQTAFGKTPIGVAKTARALDVPVIALAGSLGAGSEIVHEHGIDMLFTIVPGVCTIDEALREAAVNMERTARNVATLLRLGSMSRI
ncbi:glycerate kinase [Paenibacillus sp. UMB4589-SE434]|uniref:glycerate kinase n=1 Tax=Paenibacillus sp. UMB4589-SE434 TaxID=3046314 RepID=UPI002550E14A|nr:glycerate kinase [Paenibacillus sp. UMB4589-SE434]MDK8183907.1 glycerate kinase [Paenibacillus sp. UMB4589-SE434]